MMDHTDVIETELEHQNRTVPASGIETADLPTSKASLLLPALLLLVIGGVIGFFIGRQSAAQPAVETAANPVVAATADVGTNNNQENNSGNSQISGALARPTPVSIVPETLKALGDPDAPVTIVEFSDYQCPFCLRHFQETMPQLKAEYIDTGRVYYVFKDYPIANLHPVAPRIHEAARCTGEIGGSDAYWQAHDSFFSNSQELTDLPQPALDNKLVQLTNEFELDEAEMRECLESGRYTEAVNADLAEGQQLGINGTPGFFVNGYPVPGAKPYNVFQQVIALAEEGRLAELYESQPSTNNNPDPLQAGQPVTVPMGDDPAKGSPDAPITIVEYSDFQCPFCLRHFQQTLPQLETLINAGQIRYVFKDFPIHSIHPQAQKAHESARCARELEGDEGFWVMHDLLFERQVEWAGNPDHVDVFKTFAEEVGLPVAEFNECLDSDRYADVVNAQVREGAQLGVSGTPTFFLNGQPLVGAQPFSVFQQVIEALLVVGES
jgi:protein-disulfide isomerase